MADAKEPWMDYLALTTVILAVCATLSTFKGGGYSTHSVISQAQASDQWAYFQAKGTKLNLYEIQLDELRLQQLTLPKHGPVTSAYAKKVIDYQAKIEHYELDRKDIEQKARALEGERDETQRHGKPFGMAVIFLQVAILLNSIAGLMKRKMIWLFSLPVGVAGLVYFADGFLLFF